jgi:predicted NBD/HSP70 family sugar kinase
MDNTIRPQKLTAQHQQLHNKALILSAIYAHAAISRVDVARVTGLSRPTVSDLTQKLIDDGLVEESGLQTRRKRAGKRPTLLTLNPEAYQLVVVDIGDSRIIGALADLRGRIQQRRSLLIDRIRGAELFPVILDLIGGLVEDATQPLLGIGVGTPGVVDAMQGTVHEAYHLGWRDVPLRAMLAERFELPIYLGNDCNMAALGEYRFAQQPSSDLVAIMLGIGIGSGVLVGGQVVAGSGYAAGEIGHTPINGLAALCSCGKRGCLETVSSGRSILDAAAEIAQAHPDSVLGRQAHDGPPIPYTVHLAAEKGDQDMIAVLEKAGHYLGMVLSNIMCLLNPGEIVFGGEFIGLWEWLRDPMWAAINQHVPAQSRQETTIRVTTLGDDWILLGAAAAVLDGELNLWQYENQSKGGAAAKVKEVSLNESKTSVHE